MGLALWFYDITESTLFRDVYIPQRPWQDEDNEETSLMIAMEF
jgi:hypothetical protein